MTTTTPTPGGGSLVPGIDPLFTLAERQALGGFLEEDLLEHSPAAHVRRPRLDYESHATALDRN